MLLWLKQNNITDKEKIEYIEREIKSLQKYVTKYDIINNNNFKDIIEINKSLLGFKPQELGQQTWKNGRITSLFLKDIKLRNTKINYKITLDALH